MGACDPEGHRRLGGLSAARGGGRRHGRADGPAQPGMDADAVRRHAGRARDRQGSVPGPGGRRGDRDRPLHRQGCPAADRRGLRPARSDRDAAARARGRCAADPRREGRTDRQPHLRLGGRRQGGDRRGLRQGGQGGEPRHLLPTMPSLAARDVRLRRRRRSGHGPGDHLYDLPGAAPDPDRLRARRWTPGGEDPRDLTRPRWGLRQQGARVPRLRRGDRRLAPAGEAGQMDRGAQREPDLDGVRT